MALIWLSSSPVDMVNTKEYILIMQVKCVSYMVKFKYHQYGQHKGIHHNNTDKFNKSVILLSSSPINLVNTKEYILIIQVENGCYGLS